MRGNDVVLEIKGAGDYQWGATCIRHTYICVHPCRNQIKYVEYQMSKLDKLF